MGKRKSPSSVRFAQRYGLGQFNVSDAVPSLDVDTIIDGDLFDVLVHERNVSAEIVATRKGQADALREYAQTTYGLEGTSTAPAHRKLRGHDLRARLVRTVHTKR